MPINAEFFRTIDWSKTPLGPMEGWPRSLKSYVDLILGLPTPAIIFWGPEQTQIYNDGYVLIMGPRHPRYFGCAYRESWPETYPMIIPWMRQVLADGRYFEITCAPITVMRHGFAEEAHFTFTFSPLRDDEGQIAGIYHPVVEMTGTVLSDRRAETLRLLTARQDALGGVHEAFGSNPNDVPFAAIHLWSEAEQRLRLSVAVGFASEEACVAALGPVSGVLAGVLARDTPSQASIEPLAAGPWPEPITAVFVVPLRRATDEEPMGLVTFGLSPRLRFDGRYREFFEAAAREIGGQLAAQHAVRAEQEWREREQAALREAEAAHARRLSVLFEHAPVGIAVLRGPEHVFEVANPQYSALLSHRPLLRLPIRVALPELEGQGIFELLERVFRTGEPYLGRSIPLAIARGDGTIDDRFFDFAYEPLPGADGRPESIIVVVFDVTDLSRARHAAEAASRAKDEFFAILGHELRNPLAPIVTALQLMRMRGDVTLARERSIIERQVDQITRLVDDLLDVSRITRGLVTLKREPIELREVVTKAIEIASPLLEQRRHHLEVQVPEGMVVEGDAIRLAQVVSNLLTNAAKYTEAGGRVLVAAGKQGDRVALRVSDSGMGIDPGMLPRIFEPFAQEPQALDRAQGGLGLGLTIVKNLVKLHGGTVKAESPGRGLGTTFTVDLPLSGRSSAAPPASLTGAPPSPGALRVLVVDDNVDAAEMLAEALQILGHETQLAHDGAEALRVVEDFDPHVALLDIGLPVMDGYELAGRLRRAPRGERRKIVAVTGYGQESDRRRTAAAGFDAHLVKPVQLDIVVELINRYRQEIEAALSRQAIGAPRFASPRFASRAA